MNAAIGPRNSSGACNCGACAQPGRMTSLAWGRPAASSCDIGGGVASSMSPTSTSTGMCTEATALAGMGGMIAAPIFSVYPGMDADMLPLALVVVILGGLGSLAGAFAGSFLIGFVYSFGRVLVPNLAYIILFLPMVVILAVRPRGLFGRITA